MGFAWRWQQINDHSIEHDTARQDHRMQIGLDVNVELVLGKEATELHLINVKK
jgi:hypothetical protein